MASSTMMRTPKMLRMISGRKRRYSAACGWKLPSISHLRHLTGSQRSGLHAILIVHSALIEDVRGRRRNGRHEGLCVASEPEHQRDKRNQRNPLARLKVGETVDMRAQLTEERSL